MSGTSMKCHVCNLAVWSASERDLYTTAKNASEQKVKPQQAEGRVFVTYGAAAAVSPTRANLVEEGSRSVRHEQWGLQTLLVLGKHSQHGRA
jgi:hypothetical protein